MAFGGWEAFSKGWAQTFNRMAGNQAINGIFDIPGVIGKSFLQQSKKRILQNEGLKKEFYDKYEGAESWKNMKRFHEDFGYGEAAKSMFYNSKGKLSYTRAGVAGGAGLAGTAIAGSYIFGDK